MFYRAAMTPSGLQPWCKQCCRSRLKNPEKAHEHYERRQQTLADVEHLIATSYADFVAKGEETNWTCTYCKAPVGKPDLASWPHAARIDHEPPISQARQALARGEDPGRIEIRLCCRPCNSSKKNRTYAEWLEWQSKFVPAK